MATQTVDQTQTVRLAPFQEEFLADIFASAKALTGPGSMMPFAEQKVAGLSEGQQAAIANALGGVGAFQPFLRQGSAAVGQGIMGALGANYDPSSYKEFMNPFQEQVIQQQYDDIAEQGRAQLSDFGQRAAGAGAFGGSRSGVLEGIAQRELGDVASRRIFEDLARNFGQAQQSAMTSFENQQRRQANQASLIGQLAGQEAGIGGQQASQAMQTAGLGELAQNQALKDINALTTVGAIEQQQRIADEQARLEGERFKFLEPQQRLSFYSDILRGVPSTQIQTLTGGGTPQVPMFQQALGAGITGLGLYGAGSKLGLF